MVPFINIFTMGVCSNYHGYYFSVLILNCALQSCVVSIFELS